MAVAVLLLLSQHSADRETMALRSALAAEARDAPPGVQAFYRGRDFAPIWSEPTGHWLIWPTARLIPEARLLADRIAQTMPERRSALSAAIGAAGSGDVDDVARAELLLSLALGDYRRRLHHSVAPARLAWLDPALAPPSDGAGVLEEAARAPSLRRYLDLIDRVNPIYDALRQRLASYRATWSRLPQTPIGIGPVLTVGAQDGRVNALRRRLGLPVITDLPFDAALARAIEKFQTVHGLPVTARADAVTIAALNLGAAHYERLIRANLERARALPTSFDGHLLFANIAAARLSIVEGGEIQSTMRIIAGSRAMQTPAMAGNIRYAVFNPYWNVPVDLVRDRLAPQVLRLGPAYVASRNLELLSDWGETPHRLDPGAVDWRAVARGNVHLRVRQRPGGANEMGRVKFMLPNELGIYLHDTPERYLFGREQRWLSAGCIRLEDAGRV
ncbi:MAG: L,D-transpeptidase family protein, partial [Rhizorhabdus sp.]